jgi:tungstate transport system substrate-binding protein
MVNESDLWIEVAGMFERKTGYRVEVVRSAPAGVISDLFRTGVADLLTQHSADITTDLVADGYGINMRPWAHNDHVILGPPNDPAGIAGMTDAVEAFAAIAAAGQLGQARFVDLWGAGKREVAEHLGDEAGLHPPRGNWLVRDGSINPQNQLVYVASLLDAYALFGRVPIQTGRQDPAGLEVMVKGHPALQRPFIVMEANPARFPCTNTVGARKLSDFLVSDEVQAFLAEYLIDEFDGIPPFQPLRMGAFDDAGE